VVGGYNVIDVAILANRFLCPPYLPSKREGDLRYENGEAGALRRLMGMIDHCFSKPRGASLCQT
jgi:hypothetical protein